MTNAFDRLSPTLQYQIVNDLGWDALRPVQEAGIDAILDGFNCVIIAPTAGGKTEAALFPLLSRVDALDLTPTSILYVAPTRALLNNLAPRIRRLSHMLGRRAMTWHGDVPACQRRHFVNDPADVLATTTESLEALLMSVKTPGKALLSRIRAVVIDEVHAFATTARGSHLVALLERISRLSPYDVQRVGLSATVGDPHGICTWLSGSSTRPRRVVDLSRRNIEAKLALDFVGGLGMAAFMVDRLYPGTRRLVFAESRCGVEALGDALAHRAVNVFVNHSSLAVDERQAAEHAFDHHKNCVVVATSTLELGVDVGELEHVLQLDAPPTVSSLLQRMGRTGRRSGATSNFTFLATHNDAVLRAAALLRLHAEGYVESANPSMSAAQTLAHQLLAIILQESGVRRMDLWPWLAGCVAFERLTQEDRDGICDYMLSQGIIVEADGRLLVGQRGEQLYGARNFMDLFAVFSTAKSLKVLYGAKEIGSIDTSFARRQGPVPFCFVLANRAWEVADINWRSAKCVVVPAPRGVYPHWLGEPILLQQALCRSMYAVLTDDTTDPYWSRRARDVINDLRERSRFLRGGLTPLVPGEGTVQWWTFGGGRANALLAAMLRCCLGDSVLSDNQSITVVGQAAKCIRAVRTAIDALRVPGAICDDAALRLLPEDALKRTSKLQLCLPDAMLRKEAVQTYFDVAGAITVVNLEGSQADARAHIELPRVVNGATSHCRSSQ
jgi:ATP-dependent Lhr-like helicase